MNEQDYIIKKYKDLYIAKFGIKPEVNHGAVGKLIKERRENHSVDIINRIIDLYFEFEGPTSVFHLPTILGAWSFNKYLPKVAEKIEQGFINDAHGHK